MSNKLTNILLIVAIVLGVAGVYLPGEEVQMPTLGGTTNFDTVDVSDGYQVDGTTVIDGSGNVSVSGTLTHGTTATTTLDLNLFCIEYHATSTDTTLNVTASTTAPDGSSPFAAAFGACP